MTGSGPSIGVVLLQPLCNMACPFCITEDDQEAISWERAVELLDRFVAGGIENVVLGGGEPTLWRHDVFRLAEEAKARGLFVQLGTNGVRLPDGFERIDAIDRYVLPLDSMDPQLHNRLRPWRDDHHSLILDRLRALAAARKSTTVSTVVTRWNRSGLGPIGEHLQASDPAGEWVHAWHLYRFIPRGRGGAVHGGELRIGKEEYREACRRVRERDWTFRVFRRTNMFRSKAVDFAWLEDGVWRRTRGG